MITVLADKFSELFFPIAAESREVHKPFVHVPAGTYERYFRPYNDAVSIHQVIKTGCLRIVCQTNGIDAHFSHQRRIFFMMLQVQRVAYFASVLMAAYPAKRQMIAVEDKPQIGVDSVKTKP